VLSRSISAFEHQQLPVGLGRGPTAITAKESGRLAQLAEGRPGLCRLGYQSVRLAQYAGVVSLGDRVLEILPKVEDEDGVPEIGRGLFLRLLRRSGNVKFFTDGQVAQDLRKQSLLDVFIAAYFDSVSLIIRRGLLTSYQTLEDDLTLIRGRLLIGRQATTHAMRVDRLACRFDELTVDNHWNQGLKAALHAIKPWLSSHDLNRRWLELSAAFTDVSLCPVTPAQLDALVFDRQAMRYKSAINWAAWILRVLSPNLRAGNNEAPELIFDMNRLFESSIVSVLRERARSHPELRIHAQETGTFLTTMGGTASEKAFGLRPDIVVRNGDSVVAVGDTKWSRVRITAKGYLMPDESHIYQMQAYASVYPCEHFTLIYPWHKGLLGAKATSFALPAIGTRNPIISVTTVNVGTDAFQASSGTGDSAIACLLG
jgi:5-methylcytosine-specific restriction enzyme subunit McrC